MTKSQFALSSLFCAFSKGKYEIKKSVNDQYFWVLKAGNGQIICISEMHGSKKSAKEAISNCIKNAANALVVDKS